MDLVQLQTFIKRDPKAYYHDFLIQHKHFLSQLQIYKIKPSKEHKPFSTLVHFIAQVGPLFRSEIKDFPDQIAGLLEQQGNHLEPDLRKTLVTALIHLRNKNVLTPSSLLSLLFKLFKIPDKKLREHIYNHIIADIKKINNKKRNEQANRKLQNFMYVMMQEPENVAKKALQIMIELFRKNVWNDAKTVNVIGTAIVSKSAKLATLAIQFFLTPADEKDDTQEDKEYRKEKRDLMRTLGSGIVKKTGKKKKKLRKAMSELKKHRKNRLDDRLDDKRSYNFAALSLIHDPQGFAEKTYGVLTKTAEKFEVKIMMMSFLARIINCHQLLLLDYYSYVQKYLQPHIRNVTQIMAIVAQSCHNLVPDDVIEPLLKAIVFHFVSDRRAPEAVTVGINTIREICIRCPLVMNETLLHDLVEYRNNKDPGIATAAKSLITIFRLINPKLLPKKLRGQFAEHDVVPLRYGEQRVATHIEGTELLDRYNAEELADELAFSDEDISDVSGEWMDVSHSDEEIAYRSGQSQEVSDDEESGESGWMTASDQGDANDNGNPDDWESLSESGEGPPALINANGEEDDEEDSEDNSEEYEWMTDSDQGEAVEEGDDWESMSDDMPDGVVIDKLGDHEFSDSEDDDKSKATGNQTRSTRIEEEEFISDEKWAQIRKLQAREERLSVKRPYDAITKLHEMQQADVEMEDLEAPAKRRKLEREERLRLKEEEKEERTSAHHKERATNQRKKKNKPYSMIKHSEAVRTKAKMSLAEKDGRARGHKIRIKKMSGPSKGKILGKKL